MIEWRKDIIARPDRIAIPVMTHPGIEELGYTVKQAVKDGEIHAEAVKWIANNYPTQATSVIMDLTVEAEAFGANASRALTLEELDAALEKAFACDGAYLIDCAVGKNEFVLPMLPPGGSMDDIIVRIGD